MSRWVGASLRGSTGLSCAMRAFPPFSSPPSIKQAQHSIGPTLREQEDMALWEHQHCVYWAHVIIAHVLVSNGIDKVGRAVYSGGPADVCYGGWCEQLGHFGQPHHLKRCASTCCMTKAKVRRKTHCQAGEMSHSTNTVLYIPKLGRVPCLASQHVPCAIKT